MALTQLTYNSNKLVLRILLTPLTNFIKNVHNSNSQQNEFDALDSFTTQLLQRKVDRWENLRIKRKVNNTTKNVSSVLSINENYKLDIRNYSIDKLNKDIESAILVENLKKLEIIVNQCIDFKICPVGSTLQKLLSFYAQYGDKEIIQRLQKFVEAVNLEQYNLNAKFLHYLAEAFWVRGNISESLKLFELVYNDYIYLRRKLKLMMKYMIANVITERSEAILIMLINFTENIAIKYNDYFLLACVWQACFISEWYADQCRAAEILERHEKLCNQIGNRIHFVVNVALKSHQTEVVHRLFELLLKYNMKVHYTFVLQTLFNYRYWQNDLRSCSEIIQWSLNIGVPLPIIQQEQFVSLLLQKEKNTNKKTISKITQNTSNYELKF